MLVVRDLVAGPKRTTELLAALHPISSRTLVGRLRDMERDALIERRDLGGTPPHVEYVLTGPARLLPPLPAALRAAGEALDCNDCDDRLSRHESFCDSCPRAGRHAPASPPARRAPTDDSIV